MQHYYWPFEYFSNLNFKMHLLRNLQRGIAIEICGDYLRCAYFSLNFLGSAVSSMQNCARALQARINLLQTSSPRKREHIPANRISKRTRKSILPECGKMFSAERVCRERDHFDTREEILDLSISRSRLCITCVMR